SGRVAAAVSMPTGTTIPRERTNAAAILTARRRQTPTEATIAIAQTTTSITASVIRQKKSYTGVSPSIRSVAIEITAATLSSATNVTASAALRNRRRRASTSAAVSSDTGTNSQPTHAP